eukprot:m51a1_g13506 hypothetical protein (121) ;mRNA; f:88-632
MNERCAETARYCTAVRACDEPSCVNAAPCGDGGAGGLRGHQSIAQTGPPALRTSVEAAATVAEGETRPGPCGAGAATGPEPQRSTLASRRGSRARSATSSALSGSHDDTGSGAHCGDVSG